MREGLRSSSSRKGSRVDSGCVLGDLDGGNVPDLSVEKCLDVVLAGESNASLCERGLGENEYRGSKGLGSTINSQALEHSDKDTSPDEVKEENMLSGNQIIVKASCLDVVEVCEANEKGGDIEVSDCKFDKEGKGETVKFEAEEGEVRVGKVLRSRIVPPNVRGEIAGSGQSILSELKRKRGSGSPGERAVILKEECEKTDVESETVRKRGRPKKSIEVPPEPVVKKKSVKTHKMKGKRGRPKKYVDHPEEEVLLLNYVPFISDDEDEELSIKTVSSTEQKGKQGRPKKFIDPPLLKKKKFIDSPEGKVVKTNKFQAISEVEDEDLNHKSVRSTKKKRKRGRPRMSLDYSDGEVDCVSGEDKEIVGNSEPKRKRGRPKKVIQMKKVSFHKVDDKLESGNEQSRNKSVKKLKKKKRGRPKREEGSDTLKGTFHDKDKVKNGGKMKVSLVGASVRRTRLSTNIDKTHKAPTNGVPSLKRHLSEEEVTADGQEKPLAKNNLPKKKKNFDKLGSPSAEKNLIRNQIVNMLLAVGWTIEYRPRQGREYKDAVYVNRDGKTHWSVTKAYFTLKQEFEEGKLVSEAANFSFTPVPEEILSKLFRVVSKTRSDKNQKKNNGEGHSGLKRKPSIRSGSQNKRRCALVVRRSKSADSDEILAHYGKHSIFSWMIDVGTVPLNGKVLYMNGCKNLALLEGIITRDGIHCNCCKEQISAFEFEKHAGSKLCEPYANMFLESGSSLLQCQLDSWKKQEGIGCSGSHNVRVDGDDPNDDTCGICGDGGDLVCCDGCPSTFHNDCLDVEELPSGEWHCVYCSCKFCGRVSDAASESDEDCEPLSSPLISCSLCEEKYHQSCIDDEDICIESREPTFCGKNCEQIFARLQSLIGAKYDLGDGFSYTLLQRYDFEEDTSTLQPQKILSNSKLAIALSVMDECFLPIIDHRSGINLIRHIVYSCGSNFKRLNFGSYLTIVLERGDEVISAASIRIRGKKVAEMPFIGTRNIYRRKGMCRRLLDAIELVLVSLDVETLVIPAISELLQTWTSVFGFEPLEESLKEEMKSMSLLVFPHTDMLQKPLSKQQQRLVQKNKSTTGGDKNCVESENAESIDGGANVSEVDNNACLKGKFDLNSEAPNLAESSPDEIHPENNEVEEQLKPDLNSEAPNLAESSHDEMYPENNKVEEQQKPDLNSEAPNLAESSPDEIQPESNKVEEQPKPDLNSEAPNLAESSHDEMYPENNKVEEQQKPDLNSEAPNLAESSPDGIHPESNKVEEQQKPDLNNEAPNLAESAPDEIHPGNNKVEELQKPDLNNEAPNISESSDEVRPENNKIEDRPKPDLNLAVESFCEDDNGALSLEVQSTLENGNQDTTMSSSAKEKTLNFDLNLIEENVSEFNKLPSDLVGPLVSSLTKI